MSTIFTHDGPYTREEQFANTWPENRQAKPLSNDELNKIRADAQARPQHHTHSAANAERAAKLAEQTEARRQAKLREEAAAKKSK